MGSSDVARIVNLSGGKDSTAMLLWLLEKGEPFDAVIYMDTGWDFPEMAEHLKKVEAFTGVKIEHVRYKWSFDYMLMDHVRTRGRTKGLKGYGFCTPRNRWCTRRKLEAICIWVQEHFPLQKACHYIGLASDEAHRARKEDLAAGVVRYPLFEWQKTELDCLTYCKSMGFDWGGAYNKQRRLSCWCCPLQPKAALKILWEDYPDLWARLKWMQLNSPRPFRPDYTLEALEKLFAAEKEEDGYEPEI